MRSLLLVRLQAVTGVTQVDQAWTLKGAHVGCSLYFFSAVSNQVSRGFLSAIPTRSRDTRDKGDPLFETPQTACPVLWPKALPTG
jgi:hypothetical protein